MGRPIARLGRPPSMRARGQRRCPEGFPRPAGQLYAGVIMWHTLGDSSFEVWDGTRRLLSCRFPQAGYFLARGLAREGKLQESLQRFLEYEAAGIGIQDG